MIVVGLFSFVWHVILLVWLTGVGGVGVYLYRTSETQRLKSKVTHQIMRTRCAELQAREMRALGIGEK